MLDFLLAEATEQGSMQQLKTLNNLKITNDPGGETVCLEQMVPEYSLCGILRKSLLQRSMAVCTV